MDGLNDRKQVFVLAATNRPDLIDPAMLRPGRLDKALYVDLPNAHERFCILQKITKCTPLDSSVDLLQISRDTRCDGMSGADLVSVVREASITALRSSFFSKDISGKDLKITVTQQDLISALEKVPKSIHPKVPKTYIGPLTI